MKGLHVQLYTDQSGYNCTNGPSSWEGVKGFTVVNIGVDLFEPCSEYPAMKLVDRYGEDGAGRYMVLEPILKSPEEKYTSWFMCGGNIADTSDSRWTQAKGTPYPVKIHDRYEPFDQYPQIITE